MSGIEAQIKSVATKFQIENNLDRTEIPALLRHDYIHATLGLGCTIAEEELVGYVELVLENGLSWHLEAVALVALLPTEFVTLYR